MDSRTTPAATWTQAAQALPKRDVWQAMARCLRCRCPNCGEGKIFRAFLKVADNCSVCGENLSHHRADDLPAYLVIVIVGHIVVPIALWIETNYAPSMLLHPSVTWHGAGEDAFRLVVEVNVSLPRLTQLPLLLCRRMVLDVPRTPYSMAPMPLC